MKNINNYILTAIVSLVLVVTTSFLMTAADEPIRQAGYYLPVVFGAVGTWAAGKARLLKLDYEERRPQQCSRRRVRQIKSPSVFSQYASPAPAFREYFPMEQSRLLHKFLRRRTIYPALF